MARHSSEMLRCYVGLMNIAFVSGIHRPDSFYLRRPLASAEEFQNRSNKEWIGFNCFDMGILMSDETEVGVEHELWEHAAMSDHPGGGSFPSTIALECTLASRVCTILNIQGPELSGLPPDADVWPWRETVGDLPLEEHDLKLLLRASVAGARLSHQALEERYRKLMEAAGGLGCSDSSSPGTCRACNTDGSLGSKGCGSPGNGESQMSVLRLKDFVDHVAEALKARTRRSHTGRTPAAIVQAPDALLRRRNCTDLLLTHDWPAGLTSTELRGSRPMGNEPCRELSIALRPWLHACGHMHFGFRGNLVAANGQTQDETHVHAMAKVGGKHAVSVIEVNLATGEWHELVGPEGPVGTGVLCNAAELDVDDPSDVDDGS